MPIKELNTIVLDGNKRYTVHIHGIRMYTGNNPFKFTFWKWFGKYVGNYSIWVNTNWRKR